MAFDLPTGLPAALTLACLACVAGLLLADRAGSAWGRVVLKLGASSCFVALALALGATGSRYGQWVLAALLLGWLGDALLLSRHPRAFLGGLGAFLLSHLCFGVAFLSGAVSGSAVTVACLAVAAFGTVVLRWLGPHLPADFRWPVRAYVLVILAMCIAAAGHAGASGRWVVLAGALLFALSDLAVARDRFVQPGFVNRLWGWPTYFVAQLLLAGSVAGSVAGGV
jgi:uncharacterized membrane protein YhhN